MLMIFDDAVMNNRDLIPANMRMSIGGTGFTVCGPTRMGDADIALYRIFVNQRFQSIYFTNCTFSTQILVFYDGQTGRIVASVFQTFQAFQQNGHHIPLRYRSNDSAHIISPFLPAFAM